MMGRLSSVTDILQTRMITPSEVLFRNF
jgi:hypothetical protein